MLEVDPGATEAELRAAYRRAVQRHHPDHNGGSSESARRFEEVQEAWVEIKRLRVSGTVHTAGRARAASGNGTGPTASDPAVEDRLRAMEDELRGAREARDAAAREARAAAEQAARATARARDAADPDRPSDEELGYIRTDDSFGKIFSDAREEFLSDVGDHSPAARGAADRAAEALEDLAAILRGKRRRDP